jgi:aconitate hydratase
MIETGKDSLGVRQELQVEGKSYHYYSLPLAAEKLGIDLKKLPFSLKVLLENLLRFEDGLSVKVSDIEAMASWLKEQRCKEEIAFRPARVLMQDFTGVPAVVDLAAMREAMTSLGAKAHAINPLTPVDLVIDHSVMVDDFGNAKAFQVNVKREFQRNKERYEFLHWGQQAFNNFRVVPPGTGICHQVNLEYLGQTVWTDNDQNGKMIAYPDTLVGTDSHTTMINALAILGWGVGGIEAEAAMLGQPVSMLIPEVVGFKVYGQLAEGTTATDLVLTITEMLREKGVVGKFVEFYGPGVSNMPLANRATISNMSPEFGCTSSFFPVDEETLSYLKLTSRDPHRIKLVEAYSKAQGLWRTDDSEPLFTDKLELDLSDVVPSIAGPKRPQDKIPLSKAASAFKSLISSIPEGEEGKLMDEGGQLTEYECEFQCEHESPVAVNGEDYKLCHGAIVIAAITSCTNTSNPEVMIGAALVARKAREKGLKVKPWVKTSFAPGSQVVTEYLVQAGLQEDLDAMGFNLVGYGCTTCIGNSGPLAEPIAKAIDEHDLTACAVLSGNRNFEGRINPHVKANYLASPPLVVAYALAGNMKKDIYKSSLGNDKEGNAVYLKDIWPSTQEIQEVINSVITPEMFTKHYSNVFQGTKEWQDIHNPDSNELYEWKEESTYVKKPPFFEGISKEPDAIKEVKGAYCLMRLGDSVTTDHISPAGAIKGDSPAGKYLDDNQISVLNFNSYGSRRGNHEVMMRGTFGNIRIRNEMTPDIEGGYTLYPFTKEVMPIYDAAMKFQDARVPLIVIAGKEYGTGSSRDWAAKGTRLLGVQAVIAESYERIHRSNLIGMGVLPLQFKGEDSRHTLSLRGDETFDITGMNAGLKPGKDIEMQVHYADGSKKTVSLLCRIDTQNEIEYFQHSGILHYVLRSLAAKV